MQPQGNFKVSFLILKPKVKIHLNIGGNMQAKIRAHDGIVGVLYMISVVLGASVNMQWLWIAGAVAALQIISPLTWFCPVYFILNKMMPNTEPIQNGSR